MTQLEKASDRLDAKSVVHSVLEGRIYLSVWDLYLEDAHDFEISINEIEALAIEYDEKLEDA